MAFRIFQHNRCEGKCINYPVEYSVRTQNYFHNFYGSFLHFQITVTGLLRKKIIERNRSFSLISYDCFPVPATNKPQHMLKSGSFLQYMQNVDSFFFYIVCHSHFAHCYSQYFFFVWDFLWDPIAWPCRVIKLAISHQKWNSLLLIIFQKRIRVDHYLISLATKSFVQRTTWIVGYNINPIISHRWLSHFQRYEIGFWFVFFQYNWKIHDARFMCFAQL